MEDNRADGAPPRPLERFAVVDTRDPDLAREEIGRIFCPHRLVPLGAGGQRFHARHHSRAFGTVSINYVAYGGRVEIDPGCLTRFFLLQIPLAGHATVTSGGAVTEAGPRRATLLSPVLPTRMIWEAECEKLIVRLPREGLMQRIAELLESEPRIPAFDPAIDLTGPHGAAILAQARLMMHLVDSAGIGGSGGGILGQELSSAFETMVATLLLDGAAPGPAPRAPPSIAPAHVRRAEDYIQAHLDEALTVPELAVAAGSSVRSLQDSFRHFRNTTISAHILEQRLQRWRRLLLAADSRLAIGEAALMVGLNHLGRAAAAYRRHFGEAPSQTRRRL